MDGETVDSIAEVKTILTITKSGYRTGESFSSAIGE